MSQCALSETVLSALRSLGAATVYEAQGQSGALDAGIKPVAPQMRMVGPALTVDCAPGDNLMIHYAMLKARPGDILVVDAKGFVEAGAWGDVMTAQAQAMGLGGLLINGAVRDAETLAASGFPVFSRGLSIKATSKKMPGKIQTTVVIGGVPIRPGDVVVGDRDGVAVIPREALDEIVAKSHAREEREADLRQQLTAGGNTVDLLGLRAVLQQYGLA